MTVDVISKSGKRLMPTKRLGKVRNMLRDGRAVIAGRRPFTIQLTYVTTEFTTGAPAPARKEKEEET